MHPFQQDESSWSPLGYSMDYSNSQELIRSMEELLSSESISAGPPPSSKVSEHTFGAQVARPQMHQVINSQPMSQPLQKSQNSSVPQSLARLNDGSTIYVNAENAAQLGLTGWAGHRVIALPGEMVNPVTLFVNLDSGEASAVPTSGNPLYHIPQSNMQANSADSILQTNVGSWTQLQSNPLSGAQLNGLLPTVPLSVDRSPLLDMQQAYGRGRGRGGRGRHHGRANPATFTPVRSNMGNPSSLRAAPPSWAGADWDPLRNVQSWDGQRGGTGVFLPGGKNASFAIPSRENVGLPIKPEPQLLESANPLQDRLSPSDPPTLPPQLLSSDVQPWRGR
ncbi:hypothetical protein CEUSTIGMA_g6286.t1 [Chlamydomonas eustigma]|uniref:Uncharacterized protein n=1 Tax=Chlamydomonas eustigma TaxID=1157962 RepID=A0A250X6Y7_9CHLO|nr:hypothetical protein CEUSTIGMA_g6286.t1 [Chlamydomonas eustigma]|eukprot:GAX78848.1 hypothetical protein CEUSTIGMA_g6286.t1 [Chlamydomonas eustigma]